MEIATNQNYGDVESPLPYTSTGLVPWSNNTRKVASDDVNMEKKNRWTDHLARG